MDKAIFFRGIGTGLATSWPYYIPWTILTSGLISYRRGGDKLTGQYVLEYSEDGMVTWETLVSEAISEDSVLRDKHHTYHHRIVDYEYRVDNFLTALGYAGVEGVDWENLYSTGGWTPETLIQKSRIESDGGEVVNLTCMNAVISELETLGIYSNCKFLTDADFGVKKDIDNKVSKIYDISGNGNDVASLISANQPIWNTLGDKGLITYDGTSDYISEMAGVIATSPDIATHQGVTFDGTYFYLIHTTSIRKMDKDWNEIISNTNVNAECGNTHLGDGQYYNGKLYIASDDWASDVDFGVSRISIWNSATLAFIETHDISAQEHEAAGLCVDGIAGIVYMVSHADSYKIFKYSLSDFSYLGYITLSAACDGLQGITKDGNVFILSKLNPHPIYVELDGTVGAALLLPIEEGLDYVAPYLYGISLDGTGKVLTCKIHSLSEIVNSITMAGWINSDYLPSECPDAYFRLFGFTDDNCNVYYDKGSALMIWKLATTEGSAQILRPKTAEANLFKNSWMHVMAIYDHDKAYLYINNVLKSTVTRDGTNISHVAGGLFRLSSDAYFFKGGVDGVHIYDIALNEAQRKAIYELGHKQNLITWSEDCENAVWYINEATVLKEQALDLEGNMTLNFINVTGNAGRVRTGEAILDAGDNCIFSFDVKRGTMNEMNYSIRDTGNSVDIIAPVSYYNLTSANVARLSFPFTVPVGCTQVKAYVLRDSQTTGTCYAGRVQITKFASDYIKTTDTIIV